MHRWCKQHTMVMKFVGGGVSVINGILVVFLPYKSYRVGVFVAPQTHSCKAVTFLSDFSGKSEIKEFLDA
jgi:hypothetical protein